MQIEWVQKDINLNGKIEEIDNEKELKEQFIKFIVAMRTVDGKEYKAQSIKVAVYAIARYLSEHSVIHRVNILNQEKFYKLWQVINGKFKHLARQGLGERRAASPLTENEVAMILTHPQLDKSTPEGLLYRVFSEMRFFLLLRGGGHYKLLVSNFKKKIAHQPMHFVERDNSIEQNSVNECKFTENNSSLPAFLKQSTFYNCSFTFNINNNS